MNGNSKTRNTNDELDENTVSNLLISNEIVPIVYNTIDSTNLELKRRICANDESVNLVIAKEQTLGRGRLGRSFESPAGSGIYMSLIIEPELTVDNIVLITSAAAVAVCRAIISLSSIKPEIKWVNDIYVGGRKVCGILAEAVNDVKGELKVILGIGINVTTSTDMFSESVKNVAGSLWNNNIKPPFSLNQLTAAVINEFCGIYNNIESRNFIEDYRKYSLVIDKQIKYLENGVWTEAIAKDIDDDGGLIVQNFDGQEHVLRTGEITLRLKSNGIN